MEDMLIIDPVILNLAVALGIGLLIGAERERRKGEGHHVRPRGYERSQLPRLLAPSASSLAARCCLPSRPRASSS